MITGKCKVDFTKLSDLDLLDRIRKECRKPKIAVYSDWIKRPGYWYLDNLEITKTKYGKYRLWDKEKIDTVDVVPSLRAAKNHGLKLINNKRG